MKSQALATIVVSVLIGSAAAFGADPGPDDAKPPEPDAHVDGGATHEGTETGVPPKDAGNLCFFAGIPPVDVKYTAIKRVKAGKSTYGGVKDIVPRLADQARKIGADAIINFEGSQRFGVLPWRIVRPVVRGVAVKWSDGRTRDCAAIGGTTLQTIIATNQPPSQ